MRFTELQTIHEMTKAIVHHLEEAKVEGGDIRAKRINLALIAANNLAAYIEERDA